MGIDSQIVSDRTYVIVEADGVIAGCGGWSGRITEYGGDHTPGRMPAPLTPGVDAARIRAMYTAPEFVRRGVGRLILELCEAAARAAGYDRAELVATMGGEPLYRAAGYGSRSNGSRTTAAARPYRWCGWASGWTGLALRANPASVRGSATGGAA